MVALDHAQSPLVRQARISISNTAGNNPIDSKLHSGTLTFEKLTGHREASASDADLKRVC
jgi:hypothetical protein